MHTSAMICPHPCHQHLGTCSTACHVVTEKPRGPVTVSLWLAVPALAEDALSTRPQSCISHISIDHCIGVLEHSCRARSSGVDHGVQQDPIDDMHDTIRKHDIGLDDACHSAAAADIVAHHVEHKTERLPSHGCPVCIWVSEERQVDRQATNQLRGITVYMVSVSEIKEGKGTRSEIDKRGSGRWPGLRSSLVQGWQGHPRGQV